MDDAKLASQTLALGIQFFGEKYPSLVMQKPSKDEGRQGFWVHYSCLAHFWKDKKIGPGVFVPPLSTLHTNEHLFERLYKVVRRVDGFQILLSATRSIVTYLLLLLRMDILAQG